MTRKIERWRANPVAFITEVLVDPETSKPFLLYKAQRIFLKHAFNLTHDGRMLHTELVFSGGKKSGKTGFAAMIVIFTAIVLAGLGGEIYLLANDLEQSQSRVFKAVVRILRASPLLRDSVDITASKIVVRSTGTTITAVANDFAGFSGANPTLNVYDEPAYYTSEASRRLWDEGVPSPARHISFRLSVSTAGFDGEPSPFRDLYDRAMERGEEIAPDLRRDGNLLCYWTHECKAPWQSPQWVAEMQRTLRPAQFARLILNQWMSSESTFIDMKWWDACVDPTLSPELRDPRLPVWVGVDASAKHDSTAIVACTYGAAAKKVRLVWHRIFQPSPNDPLDFEGTIERTLLELRMRFALREVRYDPWQMLSVAQRLKARGLPMVEIPQTPANLTEASQNLYELVKGRNLRAYPDADIRLAVQRAVAIESPRGWRIAKEQASHKIDVAVALAQAALGAVSGAGTLAPGQLAAELRGYIPSRRGRAFGGF
ncbi:MAG: terminase TerL endonuclease subunit [Candidatus Binataceae bacterium]